MKFLKILFCSIIIISQYSLTCEASLASSSFLSSVLPKNNAFEEALNTNKNLSKDVIDFYKKVGNQPVWFFQGNLTKGGHIAVETLQNAALEGLKPSDYEDATENLENVQSWIDAELLLTKRFLEFITHLRTGRIDPKQISHDIKFHQPKTHPVELLADAVQDTSTEYTKLRHLGPTYSQYTQLKKVLISYRELAKETKDWPKIRIEAPLKMGDINSQVVTLRKILILHNDLSSHENASSKFDKNLDKAVRQFQTRHSLEADGVVGGKTIEALNRSIKDLILKVLVNMERLRWLPDDLGDKYIIVNVAGYQVHGYEGPELKLSVPAIVGRPSRRTPLFYASLKNIILNPSWGVPYNILVHDKLPKIMNDPDYVRRSGFTVTDSSGNVVDPDQADWENEGRHYHLRQKPGMHNALGQIKFNIENPYTIYLHGTPDEKLFLKNARAFSSGCIRLKTPITLASWILNDAEQWSAHTIDAAIKKGGTQTVNPSGKISVFFTYQTVWVDENGVIHMSDDPYRLDAKMTKVMKPQDFEE